MPIKNRVLSTGDKAPGFTLRDAAGEGTVSLEDFKGRPLMIVFGRGTW